MKKAIQLLIICMFCLTVQFSFGQTTSFQEKNKKTYIVWVKPIDETLTIKGYLSQVGDTLVVTSMKMNQTDKRIKLDDVNYLEFRRKGKKRKGILIGGAAGFGLGAAIGLITYSPCSSGSFCIDLGPGVNALGGGILGLIPGLLIGGLKGSEKIRVPIQGSRKSIQTQKKELLKYKFGER